MKTTTAGDAGEAGAGTLRRWMERSPSPLHRPRGRGKRSCLGSRPSEEPLQTGASLLDAWGGCRGQRPPCEPEQAASSQSSVLTGEHQ